MAISRSGKARLVRAGVLDRGFPIFHRGGPCSVVIGEFEKTTARICVGGIAGEAAATLGLLVKGVKTAPSDSLATRRESPPWGLSVAGACTSLPAMSGIVSMLCPVGDSFPVPAGRRGTRNGSRERYILGVVIGVRSCDMASRPRDLADRMARRRKLDDGYLRETFTLPREKARARARDFLTRYPKAAYMSSVESWRELPDGDIEFTMRRLPSAD